MVPSAAVASAIITAVPLPKAVTIPPGAPGFTAELSELTGKTSGSADSQVTELVRSRTKGAEANVPIARKLPVSCKLPTVIVLGIIVSESRGSGGAVDVTVTLAVAETILPSGFVHSAVMVLEPMLTPVTTPAALTVATLGMVELQVRLEELVTSS
jgi:hypothetical protein